MSKQQNTPSNITKRRALSKPEHLKGEGESALVVEIRSFREELRAIRQQLVELTAAVSGAISKVEACDKRVDELTTRVDILECRMDECSVSQLAESSVDTIALLRTELNERDQELLMNDLEFAGIPEQKGEKASHIVMTLANKLGITLAEHDVVSAMRVGWVPESTEEGGVRRPRPIVVRLARQVIRDELLQAARVRRGATTEGTDLPGPSRSFYVNERLTRTNRQLFQKARKAADQFNWRYVWTRGGKIFARQHQGNDVPRYRLRSEADLERVFGSTSVCSPMEQ